MEHGSRSPDAGKNVFAEPNPFMAQFNLSLLQAAGRLGSPEGKVWLFGNGEVQQL